MPDQPGHLADRLAAWAREGTPMERLHGLLCDEIVARGLPLMRSSLMLELLHPEISGSQFVWTRRGAEINEFPRAADWGQQPSYMNSPARVVDETQRAFRQRLDAPSEMPLLEELRHAGATDYVIIPLPFLDTSRTAAISFATDQPGGYSEENLALLDAAALLLSPYAERYVLRHIALDLLETYVGPRAGRRVFEGRIDRGHVESIAAAIWLADMRGFTRMSESRPQQVVIGLLNEWLDAMVGAIDAHGGETLKFMGDAVLAIFPTAERADQVCGKALEAARLARDTVAAINARQTDGLPRLDFALVLHYGELAYGNVGGARRLDFTVIGPAVNYASRLQEVAKSLNRRIVVSRDFVEACALPLPLIGHHRLRDFEGSHALYGLPA